MDLLSYTIQDGAVDTKPVGYGNNYVTAKIKTSGWVNADATTNIEVETSTLKSKVGSNAETTISSGETIDANTPNDIVITIGKGIYGSNRTLTVKSVASQTSATATAPDILKDKTAWVNGTKVTGEMPNYGGTSSSVKTTACHATAISSNQIIVTPKLGYYNSYSRISTGLTVGPAKYAQDATDISQSTHKFDITPTDDTDGTQTTYLTKVTIDNSYIYSLLAAI
jgi:hypothetical protein